MNPFMKQDKLTNLEDTYSGLSFIPKASFQCFILGYCYSRLFLLEACPSSSMTQFITVNSMKTDLILLWCKLREKALNSV